MAGGYNVTGNNFSVNENEVQFTSYRWFIMVVMLLGTIATSIVLISPAPLVGAISKTYGMPVGAVTGATMAFHTLFTAISAIVGGIVIDRLGIAKTWTVLFLVNTIVTALVPVFATSVVGLMIIRAIQGCCIGPTIGGVAALCAQWFKAKERPLVLGIQGAAVSLGIGVGLVLSPTMFNAMGSWQKGMSVLAVAPAISFVLMLIMLFGPKPPMHHIAITDQNNVDKSEIKKAILLPSTIIAVVCAFGLSWIQQAFNDLTPGYLALEAPTGLGFGPLKAGQFVGVSQLAFMIGCIVSGFVAEKVFKGKLKPVIMIGYLVTAAGVFMLRLPMTAHNEGVLMVSLICAGFFMGWIMPQVMAFVSKYYPEHITGKIGGMVMGVAILGGTLGVIIGSIALQVTKHYFMSITIVCTISVIGFLASFKLNPPADFCRNEDKTK